MTAKRAYGSGSIKEVRPGVYLLRWRSGADPITGKPQQHQETFHGGSKAAQKRLGELVSVVGRRSTSSATVGDLVDTWLPVAKVRDDTRTTYRYALAHLPARLRAMPLRDVTPRTIAELHAALAPSVGAPTNAKVHVALSSAFRTAMEWGWTDRNPCRGVRTPKVERRADTTPTPDDMRAMMAVADSRPGAIGIWFRLAAATGARRSDLLRVRWADVLAADTLRIVDSKSGDKVRAVALDEATAEALAAWFVQAAERAASIGAALTPGCYVVSDDTASRLPWRPDLATKRAKQLAVAIGKPEVRLHDHRHGHATMLLEAGVSPRTVADRLGHSKPSTTIDMYGHAIRGADKAAAGTFGKLMAGD